MLPSNLSEALRRVSVESVRGAAWSARVVVDSLIRDLEGEQRVCDNAEDVATAIVEANPSMASLYNVSLLVREACGRGGDPALREALARMLYYMSWARENLRVKASEAFPEGVTVATFSYSSTVEAVLLESRRQLSRVIVFESRPSVEALHFARRLREAGIPVTLAPDALMMDYMPQASMALVGADTVTRDGCLVNKAGTRLLALACREAGIPLVAVFEAYKIHPRAGCDGVRIARRRFLIEGWGAEYYPVFDETKPGLVKGAMTEWGILPWDPRVPGDLHSRMMTRILGDG